MPHLTSPRSTYGALGALLACHLAFNYIAVRTVVMRTLNRQRLSVAWMLYAARLDAGAAPSDKGAPGGPPGAALRPERVAQLERIFHSPGALRCPMTGRVTGRCSFESSALAVLREARISPSDGEDTTRGAVAHVTNEVLRTVAVFSEERFILWTDVAASSTNCVRLRITFKAGYTPQDVLKVWLTAAELSRCWMNDDDANPSRDVVQRVKAAHKRVSDALPHFIELMKAAGWRVDDGLLIPGNPEPVSLWVAEGADTAVVESRKHR